MAMDPSQYFVTTITNGVKILTPYFIFLVGGYLVFIKLPFLFLKKSMDTQKKKLQDQDASVAVTERPYSIDDYKDFQRKIKIMNNSRKGPKEERKEQRHLERPEEKKSEQKKEQKKEQKNEKIKKPASPINPSPEEVLGLRPLEAFTKTELKKKYYELLKQNHPDRVASMGPDFKKLAEKNTKEINQAYEKLKKRSA